MRPLLFVLASLLLFLSGIWMEVRAQEGATAGASPPPGATPTKDRLAQPPTRENPTQADDGAYLYWLYCLPCHGDMGQGLTDEWRAEYPEEEQYCWNSGCHGKNPPPPYGFPIPTVVPAIIHHYGGLSRFDTLGEVYYYSRGAMPLEMPGELSDEEYLAIMAFLAQEMGLWDGQPYDAYTVRQVWLRPDSAPTPPSVQPLATPQPESASATLPVFWGASLLFGLLVILGGGILWSRKSG
jgi:cytochrome c5